MLKIFIGIVFPFIVKFLKPANALDAVGLDAVGLDAVGLAAVDGAGGGTCHFALISASKFFRLA